MEIEEELKLLLTEKNRSKRFLTLLLEEIQQKMGYLPEAAMTAVASHLGIATSYVYGVATFYNAFRFNPPAHHPVQVCMGTACHLAGGELVLEAAERELQIKVSETGADLQFSLDRVACIGCCSMAPVMLISGKVHPRLTTTKVEETLTILKTRLEPDEN